MAVPTSNSSCTHEMRVWMEGAVRTTTTFQECDCGSTRTAAVSNRTKAYWNVLRLENLIVALLVNKLPTSYETWSSLP